jgi:hypothetical protein
VRKGMLSIAMLLLFSLLLPGPLFSGTAKAAESIEWGPKQSAVYDKIHPYTLNWSGNALDRGGLNLIDLEYTTQSSEADIVINQYGDIGALAILDLDSEGLEDPTDANLKGFTNSLEIEQGTVYLVVLHDGTHAKLRIDRILPDNGLTITKVMFSYVLEAEAAEEPAAPGQSAPGQSAPGELELGSPADDLLNPSASYEFVGEGGITLPWTQVPGIIEWDIYRSDNGAPYVQLTDFRLTEPEFTDNYTFVGHTYLYKIASYDRFGELVSISSPVKVTILKEGSKPPASAPSGKEGKKIVLQIDNKKAYVNDKLYNLEAAPFLYDGRTVVPLRFISESLGAKVEWNPKQQRITLTLGQDKIVLVIGDSSASVNGKNVTMDVPAFVHKNTTMVPIRFVSENFKRQILFDNKTQTITIIDGAKSGNGGGGSQPSGGSNGNGSRGSTATNDVKYFIGSWDMWVPAGFLGASGGILTIHSDGTISFDWNGPQTGTWTYDEKAGKLLLNGYKSGWDWTVTRTDEGITVSTFGVYETGTRLK